MIAGPGTALLMDARVRHSPEAERIDTRGEPPVWRAKLPDGSTVWVASGYDAARRAMTDTGFAKPAVRGGERWTRYLGFTAPQVTDSIVRSMGNTDGDLHRSLRDLGASALTPERVRAAVDRADATAEELLDTIAERGRADLVAEFAHPFGVRAITELLGYPDDFVRRTLELRRWGPAPLFDPPGSPDRERYAAEREAMSELLHDLVAFRRRSPGSDAVSGMIAHADAAGLDEGHLTSTLFLLLVATYEPVADFLTSSLYTLWHHPDLLADPARVTEGLDELLRYTSPLAATMPRFAVRPTELYGARLEPGDAVVVHLALANRDPRRFTAPNRLDLTREQGQDLVFSHGPHFCLGSALAVGLCRTALGAVLRRLPGLAAARPLDTLPWQRGSTGDITHLHITAGLTELPVTCRPRHAVAS
ncbi:cytochrome P450 [Streptomyces chrestomyceticus]|uniref:cytochrome P450 n=1 Tax=Streptomyces chrestomyceticus TaxID=68185 RepID=UPI0019D0BB73|nr:cytochrome P450 [Streptomyces chrestomyceticus]